MPNDNSDKDQAKNKDKDKDKEKPPHPPKPPKHETVAFESVLSPGVFLRLDAPNVTAFDHRGVGSANCQYGAGASERFRIEEQPDGTIAIASKEFRDVYLRMDGRGVSQPAGAGAGTVNGQFGAHSWEKFRLHEFDDGTVAIESVSFPGVYLRMDAAGMNAYQHLGGGTVNCQFGAFTHEKFRLIPQ
jgi:hypothetical protein